MYGTFYLLNAFSPSMLFKKMGYVSFTKLTLEEAKKIYMKAKEMGATIVSAIGHEATAKLASVILYSEIPFNRTEVKLSSNDYGFIFTLSFRPEEGKIYDYLELCKFMDEGKISIYYFKVINNE